MKAKRRKKGWSRKGLARLFGLSGLVCLIMAAIGLARSSEISSSRGKALSPYPLEVGRYWVYVQRDPASGTVVEVERRIVRREIRSGQELFFFADGGMAFRRHGMIFEVGPEGGGVNVVPLEATGEESPYVYRSEGLHIEKEIGARDTAVVLDGHRYEDCLQVITRFRRMDQQDTASYVSYYARGIGLVGQEPWPRQGESIPRVVLKSYGSRPW